MTSHPKTWLVAGRRTMNFVQFFRLADSMARMALKADSAQYYLGYIWWVLEPLLFVAIFYVVFEMILKSGQANFLIFLMCGKLPFQWFSKSVSLASNSIVNNTGMIGRINIPKWLFPLSIIQEGVYKQMVVFLLLAVVLIGSGYMPGVVWLWLVPVMLVQYIINLSCGLIGAILVCYYRDFILVISLGMMLMMFVSGIFWDVRGLADPRVTELVLTYNPVAFILDTYRQVLMYGEAPDGEHLLAVAVFFSILLLLTLKLLDRISQKIALRALSA